MIPPVRLEAAGRERTLAELPLPLDLHGLVPGREPWEAELGFGKGRYLLGRAAAEPHRRFLGIEMAAKYYRIARDRARRRGLVNLLLVQGEALYLMSAALPRAFASAVHVYFPDPWPKSRHHKRRLFDPETVDLVLGLLAPGGCLFFATDHLDYAGAVREILAGHPAVRLVERSGPWPGGARTNYEAKYQAEGRPVARFEVELGRSLPLLHPAGEAGVVAAVAP